MKQSIFLSLIIAASLSTGCSNSNEKSSKETIEPKVETTSPVNKPQELQKLPAKFTPQDFEKQLILASANKKDRYSPLALTNKANVYEMRDNKLDATIKIGTNSEGNVNHIVVFKEFDQKDYEDASQRFIINYIILKHVISSILDTMNGLKTSGSSYPAKEFLDKVDKVAEEEQDYEYGGHSLYKFTIAQKDKVAILFTIKI